MNTANISLHAQIIAREFVRIGLLRPPRLPRELDSILPLQGRGFDP